MSTTTVAASSCAQVATLVIAGVTAALSSIRRATSRSSAKCCFAIASADRFSLMAISLQVAYRATRPAGRGTARGSISRVIL
jgi:hypothetical protein